MSRPAIGLRGKSVVALVIAAALPLLVGVVVLHTVGFRFLLRERGRAYAAEARTLAGSFEQAVEGRAVGLRSWIAADRSLLEFVVRGNAVQEARDAAEREAETREIDAAWAEIGEKDLRVSAVLENRGASSLRAFRDRHPLVAEVLVTDSFGRVLAATRKTSDYDQADESWWTRGRKLGVDGVWSDSLHFDPSAGVYSLDLVMPLRDGERLAGVAKLVIDATPLFGRIAEKQDVPGERLAIVLPDGSVLSRWGDGDYQGMTDRIVDQTMLTIQVAGNGWTLAREGEGEERMIGFSGVRPPGRGRGELPSGYVLISVDREAVVAPVRRQLLWVAAAAGLAVALCLVAGYFFVSRQILRPLKILGGAARAVSASARLRGEGDRTGGGAKEERAEVGRNLRKIMEIATGDEVEELAGDLAVMTSRVLRYHRELESEVAEKTAVIRNDLEMAREFQTALMPTEYPEVPSSDAESRLRLRFVHYYQATATVGGDFFDLIKLDDCRAAVLIADVMGHGARSALVTAIIQALVRNRPDPISDPGVFLGEVNEHLYQVIARSGQVLFVTGFLMVLDTRLGRIDWACAGHPAPLRLRRGSEASPEPLWRGSLGCMALGLMPDSAYETRSEPLAAGDVFLLFTDGAVEAENPDGDQFGLDGLVEGFAAAKDAPLAALPGEIVGRLNAHLCGRRNDDDVCLVAVEAEGL